MDIPPIVEVVWLDSMTLQYGEWLDYDDLDNVMEKMGIVHRSSGYLIRENDDILVIAHSHNYDQPDLKEDGRRIAGAVAIPKISILNRRNIVTSTKSFGTDD